MEPKSVFHFFEELCAIPHGSGNTKAISDYCKEFAIDRGLDHTQDEWNNLIIRKPATKGYEKAPGVILQGHLDMVCEKEADCTKDFSVEGLDLITEGDFLTAKGTTLGGDDGIAIAYALALLDATDLPHPAIEAIFTVDEEIGMIGAAKMDLSSIGGKWLLNIDSDEEGVFVASCAGGLRLDSHLPMERESKEGVALELTLGGLFGGHSGTEIHKERGNAIVLMGRLLMGLSKAFPALSVKALSGGLMDNAIPREVKATLVLPADDVESLYNDLLLIIKKKKKELSACDPGVTVEGKLLKETAEAHLCLTGESQHRLLCFLTLIPYGVQHFSMDMEGMVETSLNPGILQLEEKQLLVGFSLRSSVASRKEEMKERLITLTELFEGTVSAYGDYPAWEFRKDSRLREILCQTYEDLFGTAPVVCAIHAGLECGILSEKIPGVDCVSFGPQNLDIHTPKERLNIPSVLRMWRLLTEFLKNTI